MAELSLLISGPLCAGQAGFLSHLRIIAVQLEETRVKRMLAAALVLSFSFSAYPEEAVIGLGANQNCGDWTKERSLPRGANGNSGYRELLMVSWIQGYASGMNMAYSNFDSKRMVDFVGFNAIASWVDTYCKANPFESLFIASTIMVEELRARQGKK